MADFSTAVLFGMIHRLCEASQYGLHPFSSAKVYTEGILYDDGVLLELGDGSVSCHPVVLDSCISDEDHDVISHYPYPEVGSNVKVYAVLDAADDREYVSVDIENRSFIIENGSWQMV